MAPEWRISACPTPISQPDLRIRISQEHALSQPQPFGRALGLDAQQRAAFGPLYLDVLQRFDRLYATPLPYISAWHQAPLQIGRELLGLHLEVFSIRRAPGKLKYLAGSESGMGAFIGDVQPERTAERLRLG